MTYNEWREKYSPHGMVNEAMARAAWNAAIEECSTVVFKLAPSDESACDLCEAIDNLKGDLT